MVDAKKHDLNKLYKNGQNFNNIIHHWKLRVCGDCCVMFVCGVTVGRKHSHLVRQQHEGTAGSKDSVRVGSSTQRHTARWMEEYP